MGTSALLISHLSTRKDYERKKVGTILIDEVLKIAIEQSKLVGCRYLLLNPIDDPGVKKFYRTYGFSYVDNLKIDKEADAFILDIQ